MQTKPFLHIDNDVFLFKPLPKRILKARAFAQSNELPHGPHYQLESIQKHLTWLPPCWQDDPQSLKPCCVGLVGGNDIDFMQEYTKQAFQFALAPENEMQWRKINRYYGQTVCEQYPYTAVAKQLGVHIELLFDFDIMDQSLRDTASSHFGYCHLWGTKRDPEVCKDIELYMLKHYPDQYRRVRDYAKKAFGKDTALLK